MNAQQFLTWMRSPATTSREESAQLDALLDAFPYFQSGHLLYIKNLHNQGSFLYNNQLKTAAAYAVNRKVLYQLITLKASVSASVSVAASEPDSVQSDKTQLADLGSPSTELGTSARSDNKVSTEDADQPEKEQEVAEPLKFPPKKFTNDPDEWEAGMLRQLQLLHHWKKSESSNSAQYAVRNAQSDTRSTESEMQNKKSATDGEDLNQQQQQTEEVAAENIPDAKEEINTLLYVLVEPGQPEDVETETAEEEIAHDVVDETTNTEWEITPATETETTTETSEEEQETVPEIVKPADPVQQEILVEAIHSTFELEADDKLPSAEELQPIKFERVAEPVAEPAVEIPKAEIPKAEEVVVDSFEKMSFSDWLKEVGKEKKAPAELPKTPISEDKLIDQFIKEEPRIQVKKSGFFNPVNMAKKSVQESDEFITETLARIYAKQGNYPKAIRAYQKLSLKFPEKTAYFAALIDELKRTPNK